LTPQAWGAAERSEARHRSSPPRTIFKKTNYPYPSFAAENSHYYLLKKRADPLPVWVDPDRIFSPTHKRTEGRFPVWCSEFTTKAANYMGASAGFAARLYVIIWDLRGGD
jgi:hypothetical protein